VLKFKIRRNPETVAEKKSTVWLFALSVVLLVALRAILFKDNGLAVAFQEPILNGQLFGYLFFAYFAVVVPCQLLLSVVKRFGFLRLIALLIMGGFAYTLWHYGVDVVSNWFVNQSFDAQHRAYSNSSKIAPLYISTAFLPVIAFSLLTSIFALFSKSDFAWSVTTSVRLRLALLAAVEAVLLTADFSMGSKSNFYMEIAWVVVSLLPLFVLVMYYRKVQKTELQCEIDLREAQEAWDIRFAKVMRDMKVDEASARQIVTDERGPRPETVADLEGAEVTEPTEESSSEKKPFYIRAYTSGLKGAYNFLEKIKPKV